MQLMEHGAGVQAASQQAWQEAAALASGNMELLARLRAQADAALQQFAAMRRQQQHMARGFDQAGAWGMMNSGGPG
jgi:hypothetical protein